MNKRLVFTLLFIGVAAIVGCGKKTQEIPYVSQTPAASPSATLEPTMPGVQPTIVVNPTDTPTVAPTEAPTATPSNTPSPKPTSAINVTERKSPDIPFIMIDPGHGDFDPGSVATDENGNQVKEKTINLEIALKIADKLKARGIQVVMTRDGDKIGNFKTTKDYNYAKQALSDASDIDLYLAIHQNEYADMPKIKGAEVWRAEEYNTNNVKLANKVLTSIKSALGYSRSVQDGKGLIVLRTEKPSILIECGYMSNPDELKSLLSEEFQNKLADAIVKGILGYLKDKGDYPKFKFD